MPKEVQEVRLGRSTVKYAGVDLGFTEGEIAFTYSAEYRIFTPDQNTAGVKKFLISEGVKATIPLAQTEVTSLALAKAFAAGELKAKPEGGGGTTTLDATASPGDAALSVASETTFSDGDLVLVGSGPTAEIVQIGVPAAGTLPIDASTVLQFDHAIGEAVVELEAPLVQRIAVGNQIDGIPTAPLDIIPLDNSAPFRIYAAFVAEEVELSLQKAEESILEVPFMGLADLTRADGDQLWSMGDQSVV